MLQVQFRGANARLNMQVRGNFRKIRNMGHAGRSPPGEKAPGTVRDLQTRCAQNAKTANGAKA
jgi:hypothetical protein